MTSIRPMSFTIQYTCCYLSVIGATFVEAYSTTTFCVLYLLFVTKQQTDNVQ